MPFYETSYTCVDFIPVIHEIKIIKMMSEKRNRKYIILLLCMNKIVDVGAFFYETLDSGWRT